MAKDQIDTCTEVLRRVCYAAKEEVLDLVPLIRRVASLDAVAPAVLIAGAVVLAPLLALLLEEATDGCATWVLCIAIAVRDLQPPELEHSRDVGINSTLREQ